MRRHKRSLVRVSLGVFQRGVRVDTEFTFTCFQPGNSLSEK